VPVQRHRRAAALISALLLCVAPTARAQEADDAAQANNPLANATSINLQNLYIGDLTGTDAEANQVYLRYARPFSALGGNWLLRATVPINSVPDATGSNTAGLGDINVFAAYLIDMGNPAVSFGIGPQITAPTATSARLGSGKWSLGFANVLFNATSPRFQWGYLLTWQASVGGDDTRADVNLGAFQPFGFYQLGQGWYLRSTGVWTYDFETDNYAIPIGLGLGRVIPLERATLNVFVEPQYAVATQGPGQPEWSVFAGVNVQF